MIKPLKVVRSAGPLRQKMHKEHEHPKSPTTLCTTLAVVGSILVIIGGLVFLLTLFRCGVFDSDDRVAIFGYGSLLNRESAVGTNPSASEFYGANITGYSRKWCYRCDHSNNFGRKAKNAKGETKGHYVAVAAVEEHGDHQRSSLHY